MTISHDPDHPDAPPLDLPGITRPYTHQEVLTSTLTILDEIETVLINIAPDTREAITATMAGLNLGDYGILIDQVQLTAHNIRNHLNNQ